MTESPADKAAVVLKRIAEMEKRREEVRWKMGEQGILPHVRPTTTDRKFTDPWDEYHDLGEEISRAQQELAAILLGSLSDSSRRLEESTRALGVTSAIQAETAKRTEEATESLGRTSTKQAEAAERTAEATRALSETAKRQAEAAEKTEEATRRLGETARRQAEAAERTEMSSIRLERFTGALVILSAVLAAVGSGSYFFQAESALGISGAGALVWETVGIFTVVAVVLVAFWRLGRQRPNP